MRTANFIAGAVLTSLLCAHGWGQSQVSQSAMIDASIRELESRAAARFATRTSARHHRSSRKSQLFKAVASIMRVAQGNPNLNTIPIRATSGFASPYGATAYPATAYSSSPTAGPFQRVRSTEGIITIDLPSDWLLGSSAANSFAAFSPRGEGFSCGQIDVFLDRSGMLAAAQAMQMMGASRQQLSLLPRLVSPPLSPMAVVERLFPQISGGAIENIQILAAQQLGQNGSEISYRYLLLPHRDPLFRSIINPALRDYEQVVMQAKARLTTAPGVSVGVARTWTLLYEIVDAPQPVFAARGTSYQHILESLAVDVDALQRQAAASQQQAASISSSIVAQNQMIQNWSHKSMQNQYSQLQQMQDWNARMGQIWIDTAGQQSRYVDPNDPNWQGTTSWGDIPYNSTPYRCPLENDPVHVPNTTPPPSLDCTKLQPYTAH